MLDSRNRMASGLALEGVVYDILRDQFGHDVQHRQAKMRFNRDGQEYPTVYAAIDGMLKWAGVPQIMDIKTTTEKNFNYVLKCISEGRSCDSLEAYRHQLRKYASIAHYGVLEGWELPANTSLKTGVLAIMDRNSTQVAIRRIHLYEGTPSMSILEAEMQALELKYGVRQAQEDADVKQAVKQRNKRRESNVDKYLNVAYGAARGFADGIAKRINR